MKHHYGDFFIARRVYMFFCDKCHVTSCSWIDDIHLNALMSNYLRVSQEIQEEFLTSQTHLGWILLLQEFCFLRLHSGQVSVRLVQCHLLGLWWPSCFRHLKGQDEWKTVAAIKAPVGRKNNSNEGWNRNSSNKGFVLAWWGWRLKELESLFYKTKYGSDTMWKQRI